MRVRDFLDLPEHAEADDFIVRPQSTAAELARTYTLTSAIRPKLDGLLREIAFALEHNQDLGRFIFGSFGSGKSHFLRIAAMMLANDTALYDYARDKGIGELRNAHPFLDNANLLVVETSMVGVDDNAAAFTRQLAVSFDRALVSRGKPPLQAFGTQAVFVEFDRLCSRVPETFDHFTRQTGYDRSFYEQQRTRALAGEDVTAFARDVGGFFAGDLRSFQPTESEARTKMAAYAHELGYRGVVFAIDEFILWAQGLTGAGYVTAVNALNALVESAELRPVRFIALVAIQRNIMSVFPNDASEKVLREQLARVKDRFPQIYLEDSNIFEIAERRVLAPRADQADAWRREVATACRELSQGGKSVLVGDEPGFALAQLYPFHPALLRVLSDVSQGLHRARSSLFMLYQLLTEVRPQLEVGQLISLGALWDVLFSTEHLQSLESYAPKNDPNHRANLLLKTHGTWERLRGSIAEASGGDTNATILDLMVKSTLLAQLSHTGFLDDGTRGLDRAMTIENLLRLNRADIATMSDKVGVLKIEDLVKKLATSVPGSVVLDGTGPNAIVRVELNAIDLSELLATLRPASLFSTLLAETKAVLGFSAGFTSGQEARFTAPLRANDRSGRIRFESFEQFTASGKSSTLALEGGDEFKLAVLLEGDLTANAQSAVDNARLKIESARDQSQSWAAAWLPQPLSTKGREALEMLAKAELFEAKADDYLGRFRLADHPLVKQGIGGLKISAQTTLRTELRRAYGDGGRVHTMRKEPGELFAAANSDLQDRARLYATQLLERRYPQYPKFGAAANVAALNRLLALDRKLLVDPSQNVLVGEDIDLAKKLGEPLELFEPGVGVANIKSGGLYLDRLRQLVAEGERNVGRLILRLAAEPFGLQRAPAQLLIAVLANRDGYRLMVDNRALTVGAVGDVDSRAELERGTLVTLDVWNKARKAASLLFEVPDVPHAHNIGTQDALAAMLRDPMSRGRETLRRCTAALDTLEQRGYLSGRSVVRELYTSSARQLAAIDDEATVIERLAALDLEPYVATLHAAAQDSNALETLTSYDNLGLVITASPDLKSKLGAALSGEAAPLAPEIERWLKLAREFVGASIKKAGSPAGPPVDGPPKNGPPPPATTPAAFTARVRLPIAAAEVDSLVTDIRAALSERLSGEQGVLELEVRVRSVAPTP